MAALPHSVIRAYKRRFTKEQVESALDEALANHSSGVTMTSITLDGSSGAGQVTGSPTQIIETLEAVLQSWDDPNAGRRPLAHSLDLSRRQTRA